MILFQSQIEEHQKLAEHYRELAAKREALAAELTSFQQQAGSDLSSLKLLVDKCKEVAPNAIAQLKSAVLQFFTDGSNNGGDGGNQPTDPTPSPDGDESQAAIPSEQVAKHILADLSTASTDGDEGQVANGSEQLDEEGLTESVTCDESQAAIPSEQVDEDEPELLCLNGVTGDCLTSADLDETLEEQEYHHTPLTYTQAIKNRCSACWGYEVKSKGDIKSGFINRTDLNFMEAVNLERTGREFYETVEDYLNKLYYNGQACEWASPFASPFACPIEPIPQPLKPKTEMVHTSARTGYLKLRESGQILAAYAWFPRKDLAEAWHDFLDGMSLGSPELRLSQRNTSWRHEIKLVGLSMTQIERLSQEDLGRKPSRKKETPAQAAGIEPPSGWRQPQSKEDSPQLFAKILLAESEYYGQTFPVSRVSANDIGYTVTLPNGDNRWYRADMVQLIDAEIEENAPPTEPAQTVDEAYEFNDIVQVTSDGNDCVGLVGTFGRVKTVKSDRIGVEIDEQLVYFKPTELTLKAKAEAPQEQQQLESGQVLLGGKVVTNGAYFGAARRSAIANARRGTADKVIALDLMKAGLSPELAMAAAKGIDDDASDF